MDSFAIAAGGAFWLGLLTSISPCPLASNIAAMSFIGRRMDDLKSVWLSGLFYTGGRVASYIVLSVLLVAGLLSIPGLSFALQRYARVLLGPLLILMGLFLLEWLRLPFFGEGRVARLQSRVSGQGLVSAGLLGMIFALSFCPVSAALFFGGLVPLAVAHESRLILPAIYGLGTGLPVAAFALAIAAGVQGLARAFERLQRIEVWARRLTGGVFILIGIYYGVLR
jgi:cytochrome c-type biogenesis protein